MTSQHNTSFDYDAPEADAVEQMIPIEVSDEEVGLDAVRATVSRDSEADEADLIEQATAVPDDDWEFDR
jgi:hypothetical protein